jgi:beta-lactam-binding protein with PASTA domain
MRGIGHKIETLAVVVVFVVALTYVGDGSKRTSVPALLGLSEAKAEKRLKDRALVAKVQRRPRGAHNLPPRYREEGRIVFQNYRRGMVLPTDSAVRVIVYEPPRRERP